MIRLVRWNDDGVTLHGDCTNARKKTSFDARICLKRDGLISEDTAFEDGAYAQVRRRSYLPVNVCCLRSIDEPYLTAGADIQRGSDLDDEDCIHVAFRIKRQVTGGNL